MENKKEYILNRWYPSLDNDFEVGDIVFYDKERGCYAKPNNRDTVLRKREVENNPGFWELIEEKSKPLFITEDGVDKFYSNQPLWEVNKDFEKLVTTVAWVASKGSKYFSHEGNADKYIEENKPKPLFVTEDGFKFFSETSREFYIVVNFIKYRSTISDFEDQKKLSHKVFYHESNADEYIWRNKRLFSYEELIMFDSIKAEDDRTNELKRIAKERSGE